MVHLGQERIGWIVRASLIASDAGPIFLLQLSPAGKSALATYPVDAAPLDDILDRLPDGFVIVDRKGIIQRVNRAFLDLVEVGSKGSVIGEKLGRWLWRPGADMSVLLANVNRHREVRLFSTTIQGELGNEAQVEIAAAGSSDTEPQHFGLLIRDVGRRALQPGRRKAAVDGLRNHHGADRQDSAAKTGG